MFCKWCGADLPIAATKCARCGKEVPAMSDCGGFYDLVSDPKKRPVVAPVPAAPKVEPAADGPAKAEVAKKTVTNRDKKNGRKSNGLQMLITCVGFITVIALLLVMNGRVGKALDDVAKVNGKVAVIARDMEQFTPALMEFLQITPTEPEEEEDPALSTEEETEPDEIILAEQDAEIMIMVAHKEGVSVETRADLGNYEDTVVDQVKFESTTLSPTGVQIDLTDAENCIDIEIDYDLPEYDDDEGSIDVSFEIDEAIFGEAQGDVEYVWMYRVAGASEWLSLDEDVFTVSDDGDNVSYTAIDLADLLEDAEMLEFRVQYTRDNVSDGSLTITISGIAVTYRFEEIENDIFN